MAMKRLFIDTSTQNIRVAVETKGQIFAREFTAERQAVDLIKMTDDVLHDADVKFKELSQVGVVVGPGSFTGIRLSIAFAKGVGLGLNIPVVPVSVFDMMAAENSGHAALFKINSGREDFFVSGINSDGSVLIEPSTMTDQEIKNTELKVITKIPTDMKFGFMAMDKKAGVLDVIPMYLRPHYAEKNTCQNS